MMVTIFPKIYSSVYIRPLKPSHWSGHCKDIGDFFLTQNKFNLVFIFCRDDDANDLAKQQSDNKNSVQSTAHLGQNPFLDLPETTNAVEYKKGYVMRKSCYDANFKKSKSRKRYQLKFV